MNFYKTGSGKLTIAGLLAANNVVVRQGSLTMSGSGSITTNGANNTITVADGTEKAILDIPSGSKVVARNLVLGGISASANGGGGAGAVYNRGTYLNFGNTGTGAFALGNATGGAGSTNNGYGYFLQDSATPLNLGESGVGGIAGGDGVFRATEFEEALKKRFSPKSLEGLAVSADGLNSDIHGSAEYRAHLIGVLARRAVEAATSK